MKVTSLKLWVIIAALAMVCGLQSTAGAYHTAGKNTETFAKEPFDIAGQWPAGGGEHQMNCEVWCFDPPPHKIHEEAAPESILDIKLDDVEVRVPFSDRDKLTIIHVYSGTLKNGVKLHNPGPCETADGYTPTTLLYEVGGSVSWVWEESLKLWRISGWHFGGSLDKDTVVCGQTANLRRRASSSASENGGPASGTETPSLSNSGPLVLNFVNVWNDFSPSTHMNACGLPANEVDRLETCDGYNGGVEFFIGNKGMLMPTGTIKGHLTASAPIVSTDDNDVQQASVILHEQKGYARAKRAGETDGEYLDYLASIRGRRVRGPFEISPSKQTFTFEDIPLIGLKTVGGSETFRPLYYQIEVTKAQTTEIDVNSDTPDDPSTNVTTYFASKNTNNVRPDADEPITDMAIALSPFDEIGAKQALVDDLSRRGPVNYLPPENLVQLFLNTLKNDPAERTSERREGLRRAVWAERAVRDGALNADQLITYMLDGLSDLLQNVIEDLNSFSRKSLAADKKKLNNLRDDYNAEILKAKGWHKVDNPTVNASKLSDNIADLRDGNTALLIAEIFRFLKIGFKYGFTALEQALILAKLDEGKAKSIADGSQRVLFTLLDALIHQGFGAGEQLAKFVVGKLITGMHDDLFDSILPFSYTGLTDEYLTFSREQMESWAVDDDAGYRSDRDTVVRTIREMNTEATNAITLAIWAKFAGQAGDLTETAAGLAGHVFPMGKLGEKLGQAAKYGGNLYNFVKPAEAIYSSLNQVESAVYRAYGRDVPQGRSGREGELPVRTARVNTGLVTLAAETGTTFDNLLVALGVNLSQDFIIDAVLLTGGDAGPTFKSTFDDFNGAIRNITAQALAAGITDADALADLQALIEGDAELVKRFIEATEALTDLYFKVLLLDYAGPADPVYIAERNRLVASLLAMKNHGETLVGLVNEIAAATESLTVFPVVVLDNISLTSDTTGQRLISSAPEAFTLRARVRNIGTEPVSDLSALLTVSPDDDSAGVSAVNALEQSIGTLAADDGTPGSGADEAELVWNIGYTGGLGGTQRIVCGIEVLESGESAKSFLTFSELIAMGQEASLVDGDLDTLPDDYEREHGLDPLKDDANEDLDKDGVSNVLEFEKGTKPNEADTDRDGLSDGEEFVPGEDGFVTDPLDEDTDDDGVTDKADGMPLDGGTSEQGEKPGEPAVAVDRTEVVLTKDDRVAKVAVTNSGAGDLNWTALSSNEALVQTSPGAETRQGNGVLLIMAPGDYPFEAGAAAETTVKVLDVGGAEKDFREIAVTMQPVLEHPVPVIRANGVKGQVRITSADPLRVTIELAPGSSAGSESEFWLYVDTPFGSYSYDARNQPTGWKPGNLLSYIGGLVGFTPLEVLSIPGGVPEGEYIFNFVIDFNRNGILDEERHTSSVAVIVSN